MLNKDFEINANCTCVVNFLDLQKPIQIIEEHKIVLIFSSATNKY